jgi:hypothetical protein
LIERMQAMLDEPKRLAPKILSPEEVFVADLVERLSDKVLRVEARKGADGRQNLLVVLDLDAPALAAEIERGADGLDVEFIDKAAWLAMRRLASSGLISFSQAARPLHRSATLPDDAVQPDPEGGHAAKAMARPTAGLRWPRCFRRAASPTRRPRCWASRSAAWPKRFCPNAAWPRRRPWETTTSGA